MRRPVKTRLQLFCLLAALDARGLFMPLYSSVSVWKVHCSCRAHPKNKGESSLVLNEYCNRRAPTYMYSYLCLMCCTDVCACICAASHDMYYSTDICALVLNVYRSNSANPCVTAVSMSAAVPEMAKAAFQPWVVGPLLLALTMVALYVGLQKVRARFIYTDYVHALRD
eukprot:1086295-Pelagomonas_calceolata.AAC.2